MNNFCQCHYCKKKFPTYDKYSGTISQYEYLSRPKKLLIKGLSIKIGWIEKICFRCEEKLYDKIREIATRIRRDQLIYNHKIRCDICSTEFPKFRSNLHQSSKLTIGKTVIAKFYQFCNTCINDITNELKDLLKLWEPKK